jgi:lysophospholipase L1-like esterase
MSEQLSCVIAIRHRLAPQASCNRRRMLMKRMLLLAALLEMWPARGLACLLLGTILLIGTTPVRAAAQTKIMPLGDSITFGYNAQDETHGQDGGYRFPLSQLLISAGLNFNFVGSQNNGPANWTYNSHEGHPGACIVDIANGITPFNLGGQGWLGLAQPDMILLMIGTNDINQTNSYCGDVSTAPARLQALIAKIFYLLPNVQLMVASIPPFLDHEVAVANYNASVKSIVDQYTSQGRPITFVDANSALTENDLAIGDPIHPSDEGYQKIADKWVCAISGLCVPGWTVGWSMNGVTATGLDYFPQSGQSGGVGSLRLVGAADLNGDGHSDFIWQDTATGDISYWLMNGTTILNSRFERRRLAGSSLAGGNFRQYLLLAHERHPNDKWRVFPPGTEWSSCWVGTHRHHRSQSRWSSGPALAGKRFR